jgi:DNA-binding HxlR family transcriptional regulator
VGERWTLLIVRDAFSGVRRFSDFAAHLAIPRAVLTQRLASLVAEGVLAVAPGPHGHHEYELTAKGLDLWPVVRSLMAWGDGYCSAKGPRRLYRHATDNGETALDGTCAACGATPPVADLVIAPGPGWSPLPGKCDLVTAALAAPHRLLTPIRSS